MACGHFDFLGLAKWSWFTLRLWWTATLTFFNVLSFVISDLSAMIGGAIGQNLNVKNYKEEDVPKILKDFFDSLWHLSLCLMKARNFCGF